MFCMNKLHENLPGATFTKPDTIITATVCASGYYPTDACREAGTIYTDYFVSGSYLCPNDNVTCPVHVTPTPTPEPTPMPVDPGQPGGWQDPGQPGGDGGQPG